jgi:hypothetical protein
MNTICMGNCIIDWERVILCVARIARFGLYIRYGIETFALPQSHALTGQPDENVIHGSWYDNKETRWLTCRRQDFSLHRSPNLTHSADSRAQATIISTGLLGAPIEPTVVTCLLDNHRLHNWRPR